MTTVVANPNPITVTVTDPQAIAITISFGVVTSGGGGGAVSSVFTRTGAVVAQSGDYTAAQVGADAAGLAANVQTNLNAEATTRATADSTNATAISTETTRAEGVEATLATSAALTAEAATARAAESAAQATATAALPKAGGTMSGPIAMGAHKVTGLTNGSASDDAAAFGQIPTALPPNGSAGGDLTGTFPNPTLKSTVVIPSGATATTQTQGDNTTAIATDAFVQTAAGLLVPKSLGTTKGDLIGFSAANTPVRLAVGSDTFVLTADSSQTLGVKWAAPAAAGAPLSGDGLTGCLSETLPRFLATSNTAGLSSGFALYTLLPLYAGQVVGHLNWASTGTAAITPTHQWMGLYTAAGVLVAVTADQTTSAIASNTMHSLAIATIATGSASSYTIPTTGYYYISLMVVAGTPPTAAAFSSNPVTPVSNAPVIWTGNTGGSLTTPPAFPTTVTVLASASDGLWLAALV